MEGGEMVKLAAMQVTTQLVPGFWAPFVMPAAAFRK